jgi:hypothetical protein
MERQLNPKNSMAQQIAHGDFAQRLGYANRPLAEMFDYLMTFSFEDRLKDLTCPVLELAGEGEFNPEEMERRRRVFSSLPNPKNKFRLVKASEGGEAHCVDNNLVS